MRHTALCLAGAAALSSAAMAAPDTEDRITELTDLVRNLQSELHAMRAANGDDWLTEQRAEEIRGLVQDVLADADTRASLLQDGMSAGYDGGFFIGSSDGNFAMKINGQLQVRFNYNSIDDDTEDHDRWGFENRRTKIKFKGHVGDPSWKYTVNGAFSASSGDYSLEDAFITKKMENGWSFTMGRFKLPFLHEELVSSSRQLAVERSLVNEEFNQGRGEGVALGYESDQMRFWVAYSDGFKSRNTLSLERTTEYSGTARVEFLASGGWKQFKDFTSLMGGEQGLLIGAAAHYEVQEYGTTDDDEEERFTWTVDAAFEADGWNLYGAFIGNHLDDDTPGGDSDQYGVVAQGGFYLDETTEMYARYEWGDEDASTSVDDLSVITVGLNKYYSRNVKATIDVGYGLNEVTSTWATPGAAWRADGADDDGQLVLRTQLQLVF